MLSRLHNGDKSHATESPPTGQQPNARPRTRRRIQNSLLWALCALLLLAIVLRQARGNSSPASFPSLAPTAPARPRAGGATGAAAKPQKTRAANVLLPRRRSEVFFERCGSITAVAAGAALHVTTHARALGILASAHAELAHATALHHSAAWSERRAMSSEELKRTILMLLRQPTTTNESLSDQHAAGAAMKTDDLLATSLSAAHQQWRPVSATSDEGGAEALTLGEPLRVLVEADSHVADDLTAPLIATLLATAPPSSLFFSGAASHTLETVLSGLRDCSQRRWRRSPRGGEGSPIMEVHLQRGSWSATAGGGVYMRNASARRISQQWENVVAAAASAGKLPADAGDSERARQLFFSAFTGSSVLSPARYSLDAAYVLLPKGAARQLKLLLSKLQELEVVVALGVAFCFTEVEEGDDAAIVALIADLRLHLAQTYRERVCKVYAAAATAFDLKGHFYWAIAVPTSARGGQQSLRRQSTRVVVLQRHALVMADLVQHHRKLQEENEAERAAVEQQQWQRELKRAEARAEGRRLIDAREGVIPPLPPPLPPLLIAPGDTAGPAAPEAPTDPRPTCCDIRVPDIELWRMLRSGRSASSRRPGRAGIGAPLDGGEDLCAQGLLGVGCTGSCAEAVCGVIRRPHQGAALANGDFGEEGGVAGEGRGDSAAQQRSALKLRLRAEAARSRDHASMWFPLWQRVQATAMFASASRWPGFQLAVAVSSNAAQQTLMPFAGAPTAVVAAFTHVPFLVEGYLRDARDIGLVGCHPLWMGVVFHLASLESHPRLTILQLRDEAIESEVRNTLVAAACGSKQQASNQLFREALEAEGECETAVAGFADLASDLLGHPFHSFQLAFSSVAHAALFAQKSGTILVHADWLWPLFHFSNVSSQTHSEAGGDATAQQRAAQRHLNAVMEAQTLLIFGSEAVCNELKAHPRFVAPLHSAQAQCLCSCETHALGVIDMSQFRSRLQLRLRSGVGLEVWQKDEA